MSLKTVHHLICPIPEHVSHIFFQTILLNWLFIDFKDILTCYMHIKFSFLIFADALFEILASVALSNK